MHIANNGPTSPTIFTVFGVEWKTLTSQFYRLNCHA
jgi:hypothetical protein